MKKSLQKNILPQIKNLLQEARKTVVRAVNTTMVFTYFEIGRIIVEHEQQGGERAEYGKKILKQLSKDLTREFGKGFSYQNLDRMRMFYKTYSNLSTVSRISQNNFTLSWSHLICIFHQRKSFKNKSKKQSKFSWIIKYNTV